MKTTTVSTKNAPAALGPYSQAVRAGDFLFCSGQLGLDPGTGALAEGVEAQASRALDNLKAVLAAEGLDFSRVVKTTIFLADMADFGKVNEIYGSRFAGAFPARSTVQVAGLPKGGCVEIEAVAAYPSAEAQGGRG
ncbi:MAG: RidA family protein [Spirochaetaceae bacterium]|nr:RidA family protein [Spirochaetaceae bacterium]